MAQPPEPAGEKQLCGARLLREMVRYATSILEKNQDTINALNVFPVPDGDTGTNMVLTLRTIQDDLSKNEADDASAIAAHIAHSALLGARGNSGLILAQYFKGLSDSIVESNGLTAASFARGLRIATDIAYKAVPEPREGTMLTVFRECADVSERASESTTDLHHVMSVTAEQAMNTVERTPEMLQVLKDAGVVDSGGFGFALMLMSSTYALRGGPDNPQRVDPPGVNGVASALSGNKTPTIRSDFLHSIEDEEWGYCTVFAIEGSGLNPDAIREQMVQMGRSPVVAGDETLVKVHVHVDDPGVALSAGVALGSLLNIDIHNMNEQNDEWAHVQQASSTQNKVPAQKVTTAVLAVVVGTGFVELFKNAGLGAAVTMAGGDTMNPSTAEILEAIDRAPSNNVIVLPNNKNIIGTAEQAARISDKHVKVIPTRSMQAGLSTLLEFSPDRDLQTNVVQMAEANSIVRSGSVCKAIRDAVLDG
ncbi:MAG: DAK2 domain-containing protein, partial [Chloroflexi bacterium]|nr:DAK2 domain-containing protein [Chloroflexota bacterium]